MSYVRVGIPTLLRLPNGHMLEAETVSDSAGLARGLMFRDSLPPDEGMLFVYPKPGYHKFWMHQTRIPLDILWLNEAGEIVEMVRNAQPCKSPASECQQYGGTRLASCVLEIAGGLAQHYGLKVGQKIGGLNG
jgi:uncharacterized membrane protein (UPF0127 family)